MANFENEILMSSDNDKKNEQPSITVPVDDLDTVKEILRTQWMN